LAQVQAVRTEIGSAAAESVVLAGHHSRIFMARLLVKVMVINELCAPLLIVLIPDLVAVTDLLLALHLNPLEHLNASHQSNRLLKMYSKLLVLYGLFCAVSSNTMDKFKVRQMFKGVVDGHVHDAFSTTS
jgi:hypothetical protein